MDGTVTGPDASGWNADLVDKGDDREDMKKIREAGHSFIILKATEGTSCVNKSYRRLRDAAREEGLVVGSYHFAKPKNDPVKEAKHYFSEAGPWSPGQLPPVLDIEDRMSPKKGHDLLVWASEFLNEAVVLFGSPIIIYTDRGYWASYLKREEHMGTLWLAAPQIKAPTPGKWCKSLGPWVPDIWQYTWKGKVPGLKGNFDMNLMSKNMLEKLTS
jgi:GH25 family lysozyme M1 (1,4-beta-N-acetylmuramidase)